MSDSRDYIKMEALELEDGETAKVYCPACDNAKPYQPSLSISRVAGGILYNCYRVCCSNRGFIGSLPSNLLDKPRKKVFEPKYFKGDTVNIKHSMGAWLNLKYDMNKDEVLANNIKQIVGRDGLLMPLYNYQGYQYGYTTKYFDGLKAIHYLEKENSNLLHWPMTTRLKVNTTTIILVEDVISAIRVDRLARGVALLGTNLTNAMVKDIAKAGYRHVVVALDNDATDKALIMKKTYGLFFDTFRVVHMHKDPKDCTPEELKEAIDL